MSRYGTLNPHTQLEQAVTDDLSSALKKRGFSVIHYGTNTSHAAGKKPDIVIFNEKYAVTFEVTKSKSAAQDREFQAIRSHLKDIKKQNPEKLCFCVFVSPKTSSRTIESIYDYNYQRVNEELSDLKILPFAFEAFEFWVNRLIQSDIQEYPFERFISIFEQYKKFNDDLQVFQLLIETLFINEKEAVEKLANLKFIQNKNKSVINELHVIINQIQRERPELPQDQIILKTWMHFWLQQSNKELMHFAKTNKLSITQIEVLLELQSRDICNVSEISKTLGITLPAASQILSNLTKLGLIEFFKNVKDHREKQIRLSLNGKSLLTEAVYEQHKWIEELAENISDQGSIKIAEMMTILTDAAKRTEEKK